jgi:hypothetical protein
VEELCDRGDRESMERIEQMCNRLDPGPRGEEGISFCKERMEAANRDPDRAKALGSVLQAEAGSGQKKIISWAVDQLYAMETVEADGILDRYAAQVDKRFPDVSGAAQTPEAEMHRYFADLIGRGRPFRAKRAK